MGRAGGQVERCEVDDMASHTNRDLWAGAPGLRIERLGAGAD